MGGAKYNDWNLLVQNDTKTEVGCKGFHLYIKILRVGWFVNHFNPLKVLKCHIPTKIGQNVPPMGVIGGFAIDGQAALLQSPV